MFARYGLRAMPLSRSDEDGAARVEIGADLVLERFRHTHARYWMGR